MQVATVTIDCIQLQQGIWVLAWVKWADFSALYIKVISCQAAYFVKSFNPFSNHGGNEHYGYATFCSSRYIFIQFQFLFQILLFYVFSYWFPKLNLELFAVVRK